MPTTLSPASASRSATSSPPGPSPMTTTSTSSVCAAMRALVAHAPGCGDARSVALTTPQIGAYRQRRMGTKEFEAAGLYDPNAPDAADRLALLQWLTGRGITIPQIVAAGGADRLTSIAGDFALSPP